MRFNTVLLCCVLLFAIAACDRPAVDDGTAVVASRQPLLAAKLGARIFQPKLPRWITTHLSNAGLRLVDLQADQLGDNAGNGLLDPDPDDGGWDWTLPSDASAHTSAASPENLYGA